MRKKATWLFAAMMLVMTCLPAAAAEVTDPDTWLGEKEYRIDAVFVRDGREEFYPEFSETKERAYNTLKLGFDYGLNQKTNLYTAFYYTPEWSWADSEWDYGPETFLHIGMDYLVTENLMLWGEYQTDFDKAVRPPTGDGNYDYDSADTLLSVGLRYVGKF